MNRTEKIASIIAKRSPLVKQIETARSKLGSLTNSLVQLQQHRDRLVNELEDVNIIQRLEDLDFKRIFPSIDRAKQKLDTVRERFSRPTLNIGVVGLMGQGKSTLLKSLSGLTDNEIPAYEGGACTAVRSTIENRSGGTTAQVTIHSEESFLQEVIYPYYDRLEFKDKPSSIDDFAIKKFPELFTGGATDEKMYFHLRDDYHLNLDRYRDLIKPGMPRTYAIEIDEIPAYVMQKRDDRDLLTCFKHLAVRQVKILCPFNNSDVGKIALVDIPGLGDSRLGDENLMLKTLGEEVDIVLFVKRPDPLRYQWQPVDTRLYDTAAIAFYNLPERSFLILNHSRRTNNIKACQTLAKNLDTMRMVNSYIADCSQNEEVARVFDRILDYLTNNIETLDRQYLSKTYQEISKLQQEVDRQIDKANNAFGNIVQEDNVSGVFIPLFNQFRKDIAKGLILLLEQLRKQRHQVDIEFKEQVECAIANCREDSSIPSIEEIEDRNLEKGGYDIVYGTYLNEMRAHLSQHFLSLDKGLKRSLDRVKSQIASVLIQNGRLGELTDKRGAEFIIAIANLIPKELIPGQPSKIKFGFIILAEFELSYRGFIQHRIRKYLDILTPNEAASLRLPSSPNAEKVRESLHTAYSEAVYKCANALEDLLDEPSLAAFAIAEEFVDRILRAATVEDEWRIFLNGMRSLIWSEFKDLDHLRNLQKQWLGSIDLVKTSTILHTL